MQSFLQKFWMMEYFSSNMKASQTCWPGPNASQNTQWCLRLSMTLGLGRKFLWSTGWVLSASTLMDVWTVEHLILYHLWWSVATHTASRAYIGSASILVTLHSLLVFSLHSSAETASLLKLQTQCTQPPSLSMYLFPPMQDFFPTTIQWSTKQRCFPFQSKIFKVASQRCCSHWPPGRPCSTALSNYCKVIFKPSHDSFICIVHFILNI